MGGLTALDWITAGAILAGTIILARLAVALVHRAFRRTGGPVGDAVARLVGYVVVILGLFYALSTLGVRVGPLIGALGLGGLVLGLALQGTLENVVAGFMLQARREFARGDQIVTADHAGTVETINARAVVMRALSGERVILPNSQVLNNPLVILTAEPLRRTSITVGVEYGTDLRRAREVLEGAARRAEGVAANPAPDVAVTEFSDSSIDLEVRFWHDSPDAARFVTRGNVATAIKQDLDAAGMTIAFPQRVNWFPEELRLRRNGG